ncbi:MAG: hypothetical protein MJ078_03795, partial [Clostridia bacterium]|nr:hypothetical protein [Clostridia bacterium]
KERVAVSLPFDFEGNCRQFSYEELSALLTPKQGPFCGLPLATAESLFAKFPCQTVFDLCFFHKDGIIRPEEAAGLLSLLRRYDLLHHTAIVSDSASTLSLWKEICPTLPLCLSGKGKETVETALTLSASGVWLDNPTASLLTFVRESGLTVAGYADNGLALDVRVDPDVLKAVNEKNKK